MPRVPLSTTPAAASAGGGSAVAGGRHPAGVRRLATGNGADVLEPTTAADPVSRALLEAVLQQMPAAVVIVDLDSRLVLANDAARDLLGARVGAGERFLEALSERASGLDGTVHAPDELPLALALTHGAAVEREPVRYERRPGDLRLLEVSATPVRSESGHPLAAVFVLEDATDRERLSRSMREFVTNAAHELQTPIAAIVSAVEVLQSGAKSRARDRDRFLGHVEQQAARLTRLVRTLLVLARAQGGLEAAPLETVRLRPLLETVAAAAHPSEAVTVEVACDDALGVVANADLAEQALANLVANALRHTSSGTVRLAAAARADGHVAIEVSDTGAGIEQEQLTRIVERFYRAPGPVEGFGLGLAIVAEVADALDGRLEFDSEVGVGTTVRLVLPGVHFERW